jgi:transcriptional regulator of aromatic amino acid metabolism
MIEARKLKNLQSQLNNLIGDYEALKVEVANKQREVSQKKYAIDVLKEQIFKMNNKKSIKVSEHAILRYLERISGLEIDNIEKLILNDEVLDMINKLGGNGAYPTNEFKVVLKNYVVTTIIPLK